MAQSKLVNVTCPDCGHETVQVIDTVSVWQWERPFYGCPSCQLAFMGSWQNTHERPSPKPTLQPAHA